MGFGFLEFVKICDIPIFYIVLNVTYIYLCVVHSLITSHCKHFKLLSGFVNPELFVKTKVLGFENATPRFSHTQQIFTNFKNLVQFTIFYEF